MSDSESLPHAYDNHESSTNTASTLIHPTTHDKNYTNNHTTNPDVSNFSHQTETSSFEYSESDSTERSSRFRKNKIGTKHNSSNSSTLMSENLEKYDKTRQKSNQSKTNKSNNYSDSSIAELRPTSTIG
jgi:hypothetical protein